jgi:hypothetical protein
MLGSVTNGVGPLLDGPYAGTVINLFSTSADVRIERDEFINGRPSDIEEVNSNQ